jgi:hypothetical protein
MAEAVSCTGIAAWCLCSERELYYQVHQQHERHPLESGVLLGCPYELHPGMFLPVCEDAVGEPRYIAFRLQIIAGTVYFSQP